MASHFTIYIGTESPESSVNALELSYFLAKFRAMYVIALERAGETSVPNTLVGIVENFSKELNSKTISDYARRILPAEHELEFDSISKNSPLRLRTCVGVSMIALSAAVILSGGKVNLKDGTFEVPSLATGIRELKAVFGQNSPIRLPSDKKDKQKNTKGHKK